MAPGALSDRLGHVPREQLRPLPGEDTISSQSGPDVAGGGTWRAKVFMQGEGPDELGKGGETAAVWGLGSLN